MLRVTKAEIEALFREVRESFHSDAKYDFTYVIECLQMSEKGRFDAIAATWLMFEDSLLSRNDAELIIKESVWDELVALKTHYVNKKVHKHKMIATNLYALRSIIDKSSNVDQQNCEAISLAQRAEARRSTSESKAKDSDSMQSSDE